MVATPEITLKEVAPEASVKPKPRSISFESAFARLMHDLADKMGEARPPDGSTVNALDLLMISVTDVRVQFRGQQRKLVEIYEHEMGELRKQVVQLTEKLEAKKKRAAKKKGSLRRQPRAVKGAK